MSRPTKSEWVVEDPDDEDIRDRILISEDDYLVLESSGSVTLYGLKELAASIGMSLMVREQGEKISVSPGIISMQSPGMLWRTRMDSMRSMLLSLGAKYTSHAHDPDHVWPPHGLESPDDPRAIFPERRDA